MTVLTLDIAGRRRFTEVSRQTSRPGSSPGRPLLPRVLRALVAGGAAAAAAAAEHGDQHDHGNCDQEPCSDQQVSPRKCHFEPPSRGSKTGLLVVRTTSRNDYSLRRIV